MSDETVETAELVLHPLVESLQELLEDERTALMEGKFDALPDLLDRKETLFEALGDLPEDDPLTEEELAPIQEAFARNQRLLESTQSGLRATQERMGTLRRVRTSFESYNAKGQRQAVQLAAGQRVEKRA